MHRVCAIAAIAVFCAACGGFCSMSPRVYPRDFDRSCESKQDCVVVPKGAVCDPCRNQRGAVNRSAEEEYREVWNRYEKGCTTLGTCPVIARFRKAVPYCDRGTCRARFVETSEGDTGVDGSD